jgi:hypothetical protein
MYLSRLWRQYFPKRIGLWDRVAAELRSLSLGLTALAVISFSIISLANILNNLLGTTKYDKDFYQLYTLARVLLARGDPYELIPILGNRYIGTVSYTLPHPSPYPPTAGLLVLPITILDYQTAVICWFFISIIAVIVSVIILASLYGYKGSFLGMVPLVSAALGWEPVRTDLFWLNTGCILLVLLTGALYADYKDLPLLAGVLVGITLLLKPTFWPLLLVFVITKKWRALTGSLLTGVLGLGVSVILVGFDRLFTLLFKVLPENTEIYIGSPWNLSLWSLGWRLFAGLQVPADLPLGHYSIKSVPLIHSELAAYISGIGLSVLALWVVFVWARGSSSFTAVFSVAICLGILLSPIAWHHYETLGIIPVAWSIHWLWSQGFPRIWTAFLLLASLATSLHLGYYGLLAFRLAGYPESTVVGRDFVVLPFAPSLLILVSSLGIALLAILIMKMDSFDYRVAQSRGLEKAQEDFHRG